jgi:hypothetical protein
MRSSAAPSAPRLNISDLEAPKARIRMEAEADPPLTEDQRRRLASTSESSPRWSRCG